VQDEAPSSKPYAAGLFRKLLTYAKPYWKAFLVALIVLLMNSSLTVIGPLLTQLAVDRYLAPAPNREPSLLDPYLSTDPYTGLTEVSVLFMASMVLGLLLSFIQSYLMQRTGQHAMFDLRRDLMRHLHKIDIAYYDRQAVGRILTRVTTDVDQLNELLSSGLVAIAGDVVVLCALLIAMMQLSPGMTLILLSVTPLVVVASLLFRNTVQRSNRRIRAAVARINAFLQEHITGMSVVQLFNREQISQQQFDEANTEHKDAYKEAIHAYGWFYPVVEFLGVLGMAALISYGGYRIQQGELTLGILVAFFQYGLRFFRPIQDLSEKYGIIHQALAAGERVFGLLETQPTFGAPRPPVPFPQGPADLEFDRVWFAYKDDDWVLRDVSFRIEPGEMIAIVGHTGAGKTTLTNLVLRFYDAQKGAIRIGGVDVRNIAPVELRRHFGVVLQDPFLFTGNLRDNIRLGTATITEEEIGQAVEQVNLRDFIESLPNGLSHEVRERGAGLSTGQKQLISFARALAHNPRFLILDEATSSVDTETELRIRQALDRLLKGRTSIVIAHRLSTIQRADRILVMHKGELREQGTHQRLLAQRGIYWKLYQLQYRDQETAWGIRK